MAKKQNKKRKDGKPRKGTANPNGLTKTGKPDKRYKKLHKPKTVDVEETPVEKIVEETPVETTTPEITPEFIVKTFVHMAKENKITPEMVQVLLTDELRENFNKTFEGLDSPEKLTAILELEKYLPDNKFIVVMSDETTEVLESVKPELVKKGFTGEKGAKKFVEDLFNTSILFYCNSLKL